MQHLAKNCCLELHNYQNGRKFCLYLREYRPTHMTFLSFFPVCLLKRSQKNIVMILAVKMFVMSFQP